MLLNACMDVYLAVDTGETKFMEIGCHGGMIANEHIRIDSIFNDKLKTFRYLMIKNILTRRKVSDTYLVTVSRHRWSW